MRCIDKRRFWLIVGVSILLVLNGLAIGVLLDDGAENLPPVNLSSITISFQREVAGDDGGVEIDVEKFIIPMETELFTNYSSLLSGLKLYPRDDELKPNINTTFYQIMYISGSTEEYQSVKVLFNEAVDCVEVMINAPRTEQSFSSKVYEVKDVEVWRTAFYELLQKSEEYRVD